MFESEGFGALGSWEKKEVEVDKSITLQKDGTCVAAVGEMMANYHGLDLTQDEIIDAINAWSNADWLAKFLNSKETRIGVKWIGGGFLPENLPYIKGISESTKVWAVMLRDGETAGHAVLIYGIDENDLILIKDPFDQTRYKMTIKELHRVLSEFVVVVK